MESRNEQISLSTYIIAFFSFIPLLGVLFGVISIAFGIQKKSRVLTFLGIGGILFTVAVYSLLFYFGFKSDSSYNSWNVFTKNDLNKGFVYIEFYKTQEGTYPDSLSYFKKYDTFIRMRDSPNDKEFYYEKTSDSTYYFFGLGKDGLPFTVDDIYPEISEKSLNQNGLIKK